jgi:putative ATPase
MAHQSSLFGSDAAAQRQQHEASATPASGEPLAARMRPRTLDEIVGQEHLLGPGSLLRRSIEADRIPSMILWGPPGSGKTTLAEVIARSTHAHFTRLSAVSSGVADLRKAVEDAGKLRQFSKQRTILFIDEIHRFNKAQQDAILPHVERGAVTLIGATTENPGFEVNAALLSRCRVFTLHELSNAQLLTIVQRALADESRGLGGLHLVLDEEAQAAIATFANGDARTALNVLELVAQGVQQSKQIVEADDTDMPAAEATQRITLAQVEEAMQRRALQYDKAGDLHYDAISALHKAVRGSDPDASLYWLGRMVEAGEDPLYIARRLIRMATEDVGMADPAALGVCVAAQQAISFLGMPEANLALAQAVVYLATAPKSNALYLAYGRVREDIEHTRNEPVPLWLRNAPTQLMRDMEYGKGYAYAHDVYQDMPGEDAELPPAIKVQEYLPESVQGHRYYEPGQQGKEASIRRWLEKRAQWLKQQQET